MRKAAVGALLLVSLAVGAAVLNTSVLLVDVEEAGGPDVVLPVPVPLARAGLALAPQSAARIEAPGLAGHLPRAGRILEALRDAPDGLFVEVDGPDEHVAVSKDGDVLRIRVTEGERTAAEVNLPLGSVEAALRTYDAADGSFRTAGLVAAIGEGEEGPLVHVRDGRSEVELRVW